MPQAEGATARAIQIGGNNRNGRRRDPRNPRGLPKRAGAHARQPFDHLPREPGNSLKAKLSWNLPLFLAPLALDGRFLAFQIPFILERCLDAGEVDVPAGIVDFERQLTPLHETLETNLRLLESPGRGNSFAARDGDARALYPRAIGFEPIVSTAEAIPALVVHEANGLGRRA